MDVSRETPHVTTRPKRHHLADILCSGRGAELLAAGGRGAAALQPPDAALCSCRVGLAELHTLSKY